MSKRKLVKFVADINASDEQQVEHQFNIAFVLTAIKDLELYKHGDYRSLADMVRQELYFSPATATKMVALHNSYTRFKYEREEFLILMRQFGWRKLEKALSASNRKMSHRMIERWHAEKDDNNKQFNMHIHDKKLTARIESTLARFGMDTNENGTRLNMTNAFIALLDDYERLREIDPMRGKKKFKEAA